MTVNKRDPDLGRGFGTGYVSIIMIFVMISLVVLAMLSFSAAGMNSGQSERARENMTAFYEAENRANKRLMQIDEAAFEALNSGLFMTFEQKVLEFEGTAVRKSPDGYTVSWQEPVSTKVMLVCEVNVYSTPELHDGKRFDIAKWETSAGVNTETHLNVWDGTF